MDQFRRPKAADLFCGAGGLTLGLRDAGFDVVVGVDSDATAIETHASLCTGWSGKMNLAESREVNDLVDLLKKCDLTIIAGGPPCQPYSRAGLSKIRDLVEQGQRDAIDPRRDMWRVFVDIAMRVKPPVVLLENVPDMAWSDDMSIIREMVDAMEGHGYSVHAKVVTATSLGVPQYRQRLIVVAMRDGEAFSWPRRNSEVTVGDALGDLPEIEPGWTNAGDGTTGTPYAPESARTKFAKRMRSRVPEKDQSVIFDHITRAVREDDAEAFALMDASTLYSDLPEHLRRYRDDIFDDKYKRLDFDKPSRSITAHIARDGYWYIHPSESRTISVREAARLQTFPDHIRFAGTPTAALRQIGNAVPPQLAKRIGQSVLAALDRENSETVTTAEVATDLAAAAEPLISCGAPWLSATSPWAVVQGELLFGGSGTGQCKSIWHEIARWDTFAKTLEHAPATLVGVLDEKRVARLVEASRWYQAVSPDPAVALAATGNPHVPGPIKEIALTCLTDGKSIAMARRPSIERVVRRHSLKVDSHSKSDVRLAAARLIGNQPTSRPALVALLQISRIYCHPKSPDCSSCPLSTSCLYKNTIRHPESSSSSRRSATNLAGSRLGNPTLE